MKKRNVQADTKKLHPWRKTQSRKSGQSVQAKGELAQGPVESFEDALNKKLRSIELDNTCLDGGVYLRTISFGGQADPVIILCLQVGMSGQCYQTLKYFDPVIKELRERIKAPEHVKHFETHPIRN